MQEEGTYPASYCVLTKVIFRRDIPYEWTGLECLEVCSYKHKFRLIKGHSDIRYN